MSGVCFVYIVKAERYVKIGIAGDVTKRMSNIQSSLPWDLSLIATREFPDRESAKAEESRLHGLLGEWHRRGEWFHVACVAALNAEDWVFAPAFRRLPRAVSPFDIVFAA